MKTRLKTLWLSRSPRERVIIAVVAIIAVAALYFALLQSANRARAQLRASVATLRAQSALVEQQAAEIGRLRAIPPMSVSPTDVRTLLQQQAGAAGLAGALTRIDANDPNQAVVVFGALAFSDWLNWIVGLQAQHIRLDSCRIEALSTPGLVSVTATLVRAKPQ